MILHELTIEELKKRKKMNLPSTATSSNHNIISACHNAKKKPSKNKRGGGGVELSTDPQGVAARHRRRRISDRFKILRSLVPGGEKMDTVSMLEEAIQYVKFLKDQIWLHQAVIGSFADYNSHHSSNMNSSNDYSSNGAPLNFQQNVVSFHCEQIPLDNHQQVVQFSGDYLVNDYHVQYCEGIVGCQGTWLHGEGVGPF